MPPGAKRSDEQLHDVLIARLDRMEQEIRDLHDLVANRVTALEGDAAAALKTAARIEGRMAEGAVWAGRVVWILLVAAAGLIGKLWK